MTTTVLQQRVKELVAQHGSLRNAALVLRIDAGYLSRLQSGEKDDPGEVLLRRMKLRRVVTYERTDGAAAADACRARCEAYDELGPCDATCPHADGVGAPKESNVVDVTDEQLQAYCDAWEQSFKAANPYFTIEMRPEDKEHIRAGLKAALGVPATAKTSDGKE